MRRILRSVIDFDSTVTSANLVQNFQSLLSSSIEWGREDDKRIFDFVKLYFQQRIDLPSHRTVRDFFQSSGDLDVIERINDISGAEPYIRTNFTYLVRSVIDAQNRAKFVALTKEAQDIATKGLVIDGERKQGLSDAINHMVHNAHNLLIPEHGSKSRGDIREDGSEVQRDYERAETDKALAWGKFCGLNEIDSIVKGIRKGELWVHAAYSGELKCLPGDVQVYDHSTQQRWTLAELHAAKRLPVVTALLEEGRGEKRLVTAPTSHLVENGVRDVYDVRLESGRHLPGSDNHQLFTSEGWRRIDQLQPGAWVAVPRKIVVSVPRTDFTDAEVRAIGYLIGDGHLKDEISLTAANDKVRADFIACLDAMGYRAGTADYLTPSYHEEFPIDRAPYVRVSRSAGEGRSSMTSPLRLLLEDLGLFNCGSELKRVPDKFFGLSEEQVALFLGALWSTDGSCHAGVHARKDRVSLCQRADITYASVSPFLCLDIQSLLLRLGISSQVTTVHTTYKGAPYTFYTLRVVTNPSKREFVRRVRVIGKEPQFEALARAIPEGDNRPLPVEFLPPSRKVRMPAGYNRYASNLRAAHSTVTADSARLFAEPGDFALQQALSGDIAWERVEEVTHRGREMTYDLSVPEHHTFVANDVITHNTTFACTWCYNLVTRYRSNVFYTTLEMPYEQLRMMIYTMHSSHTKWKLQGYAPLKYDKVKDGQLTKEEKEFYWKVIDDFEHNEEYGSFFVWAPTEDVTTDEIKMEAEMQHKQAETGLLVIDHGGIVDPRKKKRSKDFVVELNSVIRDCKRLALHFNDGERVPVLLLFQINREGKDYADKNEGRYKLRALSYANECLAEGTLIACATGLIPIESVLVGDRVWSRSGWKPVLATFDQGVREVYEVHTWAGSIRATGNHRLRVTDGAGAVVWKRVDELRPLLDRVLSDTYVTWLVTEVRQVGRARVYDIEVEGDHEYASAGFLSHNCERSADVVTTTYLNDDHRKNCTTVFDCLKRRDGEFFKPFLASVQWDTKRITNCDPYAGSQGAGMTLDDRRNNVELLGVDP